jgi:phenylalanyl-tRNA synthetase beta subunit
MHPTLIELCNVTLQATRFSTDKSDVMSVIRKVRENEEKNLEMYDDYEEEEKDRRKSLAIREYVRRGSRD